jgi:hypothetical protein
MLSARCMSRVGRRLGATLLLGLASAVVFSGCVVRERGSDAGYDRSYDRGDDGRRDDERRDDGDRGYDRRDDGGRGRDEERRWPYRDFDER